MENIHSMPSNTWDIHSHHPWFQVEDFPYPGINTQSWVIGQSGRKTTSYDFHIPGLGCLGIQFYFGFALIEKKECWVVDLISKHDLMKKAIHCILPPCCLGLGVLLDTPTLPDSSFCPSEYIWLFFFFLENSLPRKPCAWKICFQIRGSLFFMDLFAPKIQSRGRKSIF